jgi:hypothetical protein
MTTMDNRVGGGKRRGSCNVLYCFNYRVVLSLTFKVSALALRAVPTTTGRHVTVTWTERRYSQQFFTIFL